MSWDFGMVADLGNGEVQVGGTHNYTSNVRKMFVLALDNKEGIRCIVGMKGYTALPLLKKAYDHMQDYPSTYEKLNPSNGWGDCVGAVEILETLIKWCEAMPEAKLRIY